MAYGGRVVSYDASDALKISGLLRVVEIPGTPPPSEFEFLNVRIALNAVLDSRSC